MRSHRVPRDGLSAAELAGRVVARDVRDAAGRVELRKGQVLRGDDVPRLLALDWPELHLLELEPGDLHEEDAGRRLAAAVAGHGVVVREAAGGAWPLRARTRGLLEVEVEALRLVNSVDGLAVYSLFHGQVVDAEEVVARAKVIPLVVAEARLREAESIAAAGGGVFRVRRFLPMQVAAIVQETIDADQLARFRAVLGEKVAWFGSELGEPARVQASAESLATAVEAARDAGADVILLAGTKAMDPLDPAFAALERLGVRLERHGVPVHPGSLLWLARLGEVPILGMPNCGLFSRATVFDLALPRLLAGERLAPADFAELGHGGFLTREMAFRFPPYRPARERGSLAGDP